MEKSGELVNFTPILLGINITNFLQNKHRSSNIEQGKISSMFVILVVINLIFLQTPCKDVMVRLLLPHVFI
jgi:hypothetical protein